MNKIVCKKMYKNIKNPSKSAGNKALKYYEVMKDGFVIASA